MAGEVEYNGLGCGWRATGTGYGYGYGEEALFNLKWAMGNLQIVFLGAPFPEAGGSHFSAHFPIATPRAGDPPCCELVLHPDRDV